MAYECIVPEETYANVEDTARKTFAMVDELEQVSVHWHL